MTKDEAIHKALKVLNCLNNDRVYETAWVKGAINACEEALEQPEGKEFFERGKEIARWADKQAQEPVAWIKEAELGGIASYKEMGLEGWGTNLGILKPEPDDIPLYTHPHQWQGLTDDEIFKIVPTIEQIKPQYGMMLSNEWNILEFARTIEQALKEKNYG